jgi:hypothetical protein
MCIAPDTQQFFQCQMPADCEHSRRVCQYGYLVGRYQNSHPNSNSSKLHSLEVFMKMELKYILLRYVYANLWILQLIACSCTLSTEDDCRL